MTEYSAGLYTVEAGRLKLHLHPAQAEVFNLWIKYPFKRLEDMTEEEKKALSPETIALMERIDKEYNKIPSQILFSAGTGGGKTAFGIILLYSYWQKLKRERGRNYKAKFIVTAPTYKLLHDIIIDDLVRTYNEFNLGIYKSGANPKYEMRDGSVIYFRNSQQPHSIEGVHADFIWSDEIGYDTNRVRVPEKTYNVMLDRIRAKNGKLFMTTTPYKYNWVARRIVGKARILNFDIDIESATEHYKVHKSMIPEELMKKGILKRVWEKSKGDDNILVVKFPSILNPTYDFEGFLRSKTEWDEANYKMRFWGDWFMSESRVLYAFSEEQHIIAPFKIPEEWEAFLGIDYGKNDPFAASWIVRDPETGKWYVVFEYLETRKDNLKHAKEVARLTRLLHKRIGFPMNFTRIYTDPSGGYRSEQNRQNMVDFVRALKAQGIDTQPAQAYNAVSGGVAILNSLFEQNKLFITITCEQTIRQALEWEELSAKHGHEHNWDAIRYVIATEEKINGRYNYGKEEEEKDKKDEQKPLTYEEYVRVMNAYFNKARRRNNGVYIG